MNGYKAVICCECIISATGLFALPGGILKKDETLNRTAKRILFERTGLSFLMQLNPEFHS